MFSEQGIHHLSLPARGVWGHRDGRQRRWGVEKIFAGQIGRILPENLRDSEVVSARLWVGDWPSQDCRFRRHIGRGQGARTSCDQPQARFNPEEGASPGDAGASPASGAAIRQNSRVAGSGVGWPVPEPGRDDRGASGSITDWAYQADLTAHSVSE
jgi:hypothetical protein